MLIEPTTPIAIRIQIGRNQFESRLVSLSETEIELTTNHYFEKETQIHFLAKYFRGLAEIKEIHFINSSFIYKLEIMNIQFQPGLLINTRL
nr:hypothetical protein [Legionella waltersii]